jgi:hypothetical protein
MDSSGELKIIGILDGGQDLERDLHVRFARYRLHGEWFEHSPELRGYLHLRCGGIRRFVDFMTSSVGRGRHRSVLVSEMFLAFREFEKQRDLLPIHKRSFGAAANLAARLAGIKWTYENKDVRLHGWSLKSEQHGAQARRA